MHRVCFRLASEVLVDLSAVLLAVLLLAMPWRLVQLLVTLWRQGSYEASNGALEQQAPLLGEQQSVVPWQREVLWHFVAGLVDFPCFLSYIVLVLTCRAAALHASLRTCGGYFGRNLRGQMLLKPQKALLYYLFAPCTGRCR